MAQTPAADRPPEFWDAVYDDYRDGKLTLRLIFAKYRLTAGAFHYAKQQRGWKRRKATPISRKALIRRMFRLVERMTLKLDDEMTTVGEKEVNVLGRLVGTMAKLIEIETATGKTASPRETREMRSIREKLVERIEELKRN